MFAPANLNRKPDLPLPPVFACPVAPKDATMQKLLSLDVQIASYPGGTKNSSSQTTLYIPGLFEDEGDDVCVAAVAAARSRLSSTS